MLTVPSNTPQWLSEFATRIDEAIAEAALRASTLPAHTVANLPSASKYYSGHPTLGYSRLIYVTNESGGAVPAFTDGTNWRRCTDRAIVS